MINKFEMVLIILVCFFASTFSDINAQHIDKYHELDKQFLSYEILNINSSSVFQNVKSNRNNNEVNLKINDQTTWNLILENSEIIADNYFVTEATSSGKIIKNGTTALPMQGHVKGQPNSRVSLTFNDNFIYGFIKLGTTTYFIEPLSHYSDTPVKDKFVLYSTNDIIKRDDKKCGYDIYKEQLESKREHIPTTGQRVTGLCFRIEIALASDYSMVQTYGTTGTTNHNIGVLNNVQTNYDDEFDDELQFVITEQWISSCASCDPWTSLNDPYVLLDDFTAWGVSGFSSSHDVASLWSHRNFTGGVIGLAWLGAACTSNKYNVLQDFSTNAEMKRVLQAHELGHNFDATHNTGIMAPSVSTSTVWSSTSISEINAYYQSLTCLDNCPGSSPPTPDFTYLLVEPCTPAEVQFTNTSSNSTSWLWTFDGGTPATSTEENPLVTYTESGSHDVTLQAFNGSVSNTITLPIVVNVIEPPIADFVYNINGLLVNFIYTGSGATSYSWTFGSGAGASSTQNPTYTYTTNGVYDVTLTVYNQCGTSTVTYPVEISEIPFVNFSSNVTTGCQPQTITFNNLSSNAVSYLWTFPGGTPSVSTLQNPVVVYATAGSYNVTLEATNSAGSNVITKTDYIVIAPNPTAGFTSTMNGTQVAFTNTSQNGSSYSWSFGDGNMSSQSNPTHTYTDNGVYPVIQTVTNSCGSATMTQNITIALAPNAGYTVNIPTPFCAGQTLNFTNTTTYSPTSFLWTFEGGTPATSTEANPIVMYSAAGTYDVTLVATNSNGSSQSYFADAVVVNDKPSVSFTSLGDGLQVDFTQNIQNGTGHTWTFGDGQSSTSNNPTHNYSAEGTYTVTLSDTNICGTTTNSQNILVQLLPTAGFSTASTSVCQGAHVQFSDNSSQSVTSWLWTFEGGSPATSTLENPVVSYAQTGSFNVSLTVSNNSGQNTTTITDYINVITAPASVFTGSVANNIISLSNNIAAANSSLWTIFNGNTTITLTGDQVNFTAPSNGDYGVYLTNSNQCGQTHSDTVYYSINAYPIASFSVNNGNGACATQPISFAAPSGNGMTYSWSFVNGDPAVSTIQNPVVSFAQSGTYPVTLIMANSFGADTVTSNVVVGTLPSALFTEQINNSNVQFNFTGGGQTNLTWNFGDGTTSTELNPNHTYSSTGVYNVVLISSNGCGQDTLIKSLNIIVSATSNQNDKVSVLLKPNPTSDYSILDVNGLATGQYNLSMTDLSGKMVFSQPLFISNRFSTSIDGSNLPQGMYIVKISGENVNKAIKLFVTR